MRVFVAVAVEIFLLLTLHLFKPDFVDQQFPLHGGAVTGFL
jgi:hypothetical protein